MKTRIVPEGEDAVFHVISRVAFQLLNLKTEEKRVFRDILAKQATFSGIQVLSYCLLDNHFHILVRVPFESTITDAELLKRYRTLYEDAEPRYTMMPDELETLLKTGGERANTIRKQLTARMGSISIFMKELKQRFSIWYNRKHENSGTLWAKRFDSILVENVKQTLQLISTYIDLNPVRLNLCQESKNYPFCTIGAAHKGHPLAQEYLAHTFKCKTWSKTLLLYQKFLSKYSESLSAGTASIHGMKTGVLGSNEYVSQWSNAKNKKRKSKSSTPMLLLGGLLYVGACALGVRSTFHTPS